MNKFKAKLGGLWASIRRIPVVIGGAFLLFVSFPVVVPICAALAMVPVSAAVVSGAAIADGKRKKLKIVVIVMRVLISLAALIVAFLIGLVICELIGIEPFPWE